jgi:hypothetical protein
VEVDISMSPRIIAIAPASTRTAEPPETVISASANMGPDSIVTSIRASWCRPGGRGITRFG